eukprot:1751827-Amphidinium_carterae.1
MGLPRCSSSALERARRYTDHTSTLGRDKDLRTVQTEASSDLSCQALWSSQDFAIVFEKDGCLTLA